MMKVFEGYSMLTHAAAAVADATADWGEAAAPDMIFAFHSMQQLPQAMAQALQARFPKSLIAGGTSAAEWRTGVYQKASLVLAAISSPNIRWSMEVVEDISVFAEQEAADVYRGRLAGLGIAASDLRSERHFCIGFLDGVIGLDGSVVAAISNQLGCIPFLGGMVSDDLDFAETFVLANGRAISGGAVFILAECDEPFYAFKHQHFVPGTVDMVITKADESLRKVWRLDGKPAAERYAKLLGCAVEDLNFQIFSDHPVIYQYGQESYVRTIVSANDDGSLTFYCAIEEGMVLNLCRQKDMAGELAQQMSQIEKDYGKAKFLLWCNCSCRGLEAEGKMLNQDFAKLSARVATHVVGFDTFGELWNGLHINQTLVGLAIGQE